MNSPKRTGANLRFFFILILHFFVRIRLEVSSSNFPRFDRNLNTGKDASSSSDYVKATNTILHDAAHPSALILPVVGK